MTHTLLFEIWGDETGAALEMSVVSQRADDLRKTISPGARLLHSYRARSDFDAFRMKNAWLGFEPWRPEADWEERFFTAEDVAEQARYLAIRGAGDR